MGKKKAKEPETPAKDEVRIFEQFSSKMCAKLAIFFFKNFACKRMILKPGMVE